MNGAHLHLILNHAPVLGTVFGLAILGFALWRKSEELIKTTLGIFAVVAVCAVAAYLTGEPAEDVIRKVPGLANPPIGRHEDAAGIALGGSIALGVVALGSLIWFRGVKSKPWVNKVVLAGAIIVSALMAWTAFLGGQIRHTEAYSSAPWVSGPGANG